MKSINWITPTMGIIGGNSQDLIYKGAQTGHWIVVKNGMPREFRGKLQAVNYATERARLKKIQREVQALNLRLKQLGNGIL